MSHPAAPSSQQQPQQHPTLQQHQQQQLHQGPCTQHQSTPVASAPHTNLSPADSIPPGQPDPPTPATTATSQLTQVQTESQGPALAMQGQPHFGPISQTQPYIGSVSQTQPMNIEVAQPPQPLHPQHTLTNMQLNSTRGRPPTNRPSDVHPEPSPPSWPAPPSPHTPTLRRSRRTGPQRLAPTSQFTIHTPPPNIPFTPPRSGPAQPPPASRFSTSRRRHPHLHARPPPNLPTLGHTVVTALSSGPHPTQSSSASPTTKPQIPSTQQDDDDPFNFRAVRHCLWCVGSKPYPTVTG